jgi:2-polyprenyl-3-methyl-5-hydroxy-6-metoxy-1,4-benzoquinol methylase
MIQPLEELENWQKKQDPWSYKNNPEDEKRKDILLSEIPQKKYLKVLDIGCGQGYITKCLPGKLIVGTDISEEAIKIAQKNIKKENIKFIQNDIFKLDQKFPNDKFDLIIITGVLYPQYIGKSSTLIYKIIDKVLNKNGILISVHINDWYISHFPYLLLKEYYYNYREFVHKLEIYTK